jgi:hypothetical protein
MKKMTQKAVIYCFLFFLVLISAVYFFRHIYGYLRLTHYHKSEILVVEGWLPRNALDLARSEFLQSNYKLIITTGLPYYRGFQMGSNGKVEFTLCPKLQASRDSIYSVVVVMRGTKADGVFAHFIVYADTVELGENYSTRKKKSYAFQVKLNSPPEKICAVFDNDTYTRFRDRNLILYSATVNGQVFPANRGNVTYYVRRNGMYFLGQRLSNSTATDAANYLIETGIPDSLVVPVETLHKIKSKTYTTALDVKAWLDKNRPAVRPSITIFTQTIHARRSYVSFKKAFGNSADIGVISCSDRMTNRLNWWKSPEGWKEMLYETTGVIYALIVL